MTASPALALRRVLLALLLALGLTGAALVAGGPHGSLLLGSAAAQETTDTEDTDTDTDDSDTEDSDSDTDTTDTDTGTAPTGGVDTGAGGTAGDSTGLWLLLGAGAAVAVGSGAAVRRARSSA